METTKQASKALKVCATLNFIGIFIFTIPGLTYFAIFNLVGYLIKSKELRHYSSRCLVAPDQWWNAALLGEEDETVSSRLGRALESGKPKLGAKIFAIFVDSLFLAVLGEKEHCKNAIEQYYLQYGAPSDETWGFIKD